MEDARLMAQMINQNAQTQHAAARMTNAPWAITKIVIAKKMIVQLTTLKINLNAPMKRARSRTENALRATTKTVSARKMSVRT